MNFYIQLLYQNNININHYKIIKYLLVYVIIFINSKIKIMKASILKSYIHVIYKRFKIFI